MGFYIRNCLGFFLQAAPCMLLCFLPWSQEVCRLKRGKIIGSFVLGIAAASVGFAALMGSLRTEGSFVWSTAANLYMLGLIVFCCAAYFRLIRENTVKKLLVVNLAVIYAAVQFMIVNTAAPLIDARPMEEMYPPYVFWLYAGTTAVMLPAAAGSMRGTVRAYLRDTEPGIVRKGFTWTLICSMAFFALLVFYNAAVVRIEEWTTFWALLSPPFLFAAAALMVLYWGLLREAVRRKRDYEKKRLEEIQSMQYAQLEKDVEKARRARHDLRHHLGALYQMADEGDCEKVKGYISELLERSTRTEVEYFCENTTVNGLLRHYIGAARENGIDCTVKAVCGELPVSQVDLAAVLGNALENAVNGCVRYGEGGWIRVNIGVFSGSLAIQIENACSGIWPAGKEFQDNCFVSARAYRSSRRGGGMGLESITQTARKYDGDAGFRYSAGDKTFTARIRLGLCGEVREKDR